MKLPIVAVLSCYLLASFSGTKGFYREYETDTLTNLDASNPEVVDRSGQANTSDGGRPSEPSANTIDLKNTESHTIKADTFDEAIRVLAMKYQQSPILIITEPSEQDKRGYYPYYFYYPVSSSSSEPLNVVNTNNNTFVNTFMIAG